MGSKMWLGWVKVDVDKWLVEMRGVDPVTAMAYMRLSFVSRNTAAAPGEICAMLETIAKNMAEMETEETWLALVRMTRLYSVDGLGLVRVMAEDNGVWKEIVSGGKDHLNLPSGKVKIRFAWIADMVQEIEQEAKQETLRRNKYRTPKDAQGCTRTHKAEEGATVTPKDASLDKIRLDKSRVDNTPVVPKGTVLEKWFSEVFWPAYPRKVKKPQAWKAAKGALKKVEADRIMGALERAKEGDHRFQEARFTPYPASWLNEEPWGNEGDGEVLKCGSSRVLKFERGVEKNQKSAASGELLIGMPPAGAE